VQPPATNIPAPDDFVGKKGFKFDRLGVRIPTVVVSPWIKKGTLVNKPSEAQKPSEHSEFELCSIPATIIKMFGLKGRLTKRTDFAATFDDIISDELRTDCIEKLAEIRKPHPFEMERQMNLVIDDTS